ncbi:MAG: YIP1 family protein [Rhodobacteraceae bacterium]|nr:YIP1 family protein [Paracoccaceae bacterium]
MSLLADMLETHYRPARVQARRLARRPEERNLLALLALVCLVTFLTRLPFLVETQASAVEPLEARVAAMLIATMLFGPLFLYAVAALSHLVALALGGQGGWFQARLALIWTLFAFQPLVVVSVILGRLGGPGQPSVVIGLGLLVWFMTAWIIGLWHHERPLGGVAHAEKQE